MSGFDFNKIKDFDKHIALSTPNYEWLIEQVIKFSQYFIDKRTNVYDLGCSTGTLLKRLSKIDSVNYIGLDNSNLLPESDEYCDFIKVDLATYDDFNNCSFATSIFTLQFLARNERKKLIEKVANALNRYGAFIVCEKTYSSNSTMQDITNSMYYEFKEKNFNGIEILKKERELRYNLKMLNLNDILDELKIIGQPEIFWRSFNFVGCIVIKS